ncbi:uncharacterized protein LOC127647215 isoform X2 [Xyrauchen texanus]|uniref:uncharacterized protein LOC127647215 isoform X2 n=1 Tax=Xyrauchen texanus TaxID=154827 RepID=UPI0022427318|nr:uncharacterized protein LOC127647215 isoform X2 [Xyrauchen texanus]
MDLLLFIFVSVILNISDGFTVKGPSGPLVVPLGGSVVLPCYVDKPLRMEDLEVDWRRSDTETLVHLYQDGESRPEVQQQDYHDRAHFFTDQIQHGNFSLLLNNVTAEDEGKYRCKVFSGQDSGETVVEIKHVERLIVSGSDHSISAYAGEDVTLNCSVDSHITPEEIEELSWKKTDKDGDILVLLYQNNEPLPESSHEQYIDRVEFFTDEISKGNFSLRLKSVRTEDKGVYMCQVFAGGVSANTTVELEQLGLSGLHIMVLILCITAAGAALVLCLIYFTSQKKGFIVKYSTDYSPGRPLVLPCFIDPHLLKKDLKVEWRRSGDKSDLVCQYPDNKSRPEDQQQDYHDRAHFFTDQIQHGNFSLLLNNVTAEDEGEYRCTGYSKRGSVFSGSTTLNTFFKVVVEHTCDLVVPLGGSVVLPCLAVEPLPMEDLKVEWRRSGDKSDLVCQYPDNKSRPEDQQQDYHDRAHFFTDQIQHGNFSLLLNNVTAEDEGQYECKVFSGQRYLFSVSTLLVPRLLDSVLRLHVFLVFCPNIIMFCAFVLWGVSEGSVNETVLCCVLYLLRPLMLLWAAPDIKVFTGKIYRFINSWSCDSEYFIFSTVVYSVLFKSALDKGLSYAGFEGVVIIVLFVIVLLLSLFYFISMFAVITGKLSERIKTIFGVLAGISFNLLPSLQFVLLIYAFGGARGGFFIVAVLPVLTTVTRYNWNVTCGEKIGCSPLVRRSVWLVLMSLMNAVMIYFCITALANETDSVGWGCLIGFLQLLWTVMNFTYSFADWDLPRLVPVYLFGSVGVVLISAVSLMTELILKTVNGERAVGDLRIVVFSCESFLTFFLLILLVFKPWIKTCLQSCQNAARARTNRTQDARSNQNENQSSQVSIL